jgi:transcriptional antiterminator NusG
MNDPEGTPPDQETPEMEGEILSEQTVESETEPVTEEPVAAESTETTPEQEETVPEQAEETELPVEKEEIPVEPVMEKQAAETTPPIEQNSEKESASEGDESEELAPAPEPIPDDGRLWYVLHCYSGYENKVRHNLEQRIDSMGMKSMIFDVVVPTEEEIEVKEGKRRTVERRVFPGYILVNMVLTEDSWYVVRNTPGVTSFVGQGNEPLPLRPEEVSQIIKRMEADAPRIKVTFKQGERVRIVDGPFNDFRGNVDEIDMERAKVRVMVNFFGRETPVELDFLQVEKA